MMNQLHKVAVSLFYLLTLHHLSFSQSTTPEFLGCNPDIVYAWCKAEDGVRLPDNNKIYLGDDHPEATSCTVHLNRKVKVNSQCGSNLEYEVLLMLNDSSSIIILQPTTSVSIDSLGTAELIFDSALSPNSEIQENGIPYSDCKPYMIKWIARDACGNESICEEKFELFDCFPPVAILSDSFYMIHTNNTGHVLISVDTIIHHLIGDCGDAHDFLFSLREETYVTDSLLYVCDIPAFGVAVPWNFWIADKGRDLNCDGSISWAERQKIKHQFNIIFRDQGNLDCEKEWNTLSGNIYTADERPIKNAEVFLFNEEVLIASQITGIDGQYYFGPETMLPENYTIKVSRDDYHKNGVSTTDIVKFMKHLLGVNTLDNPYHVIAADVNNSHNLSAIDIIEIRKVILGINIEFPNSPSWKFVPADFVLDPQNPQAYPEEVHVMNAHSIHHQDFIGVKMGDLNHTAVSD